MPKTSKKKKYNARFPPTRIKKIMQTDEEVGKVAAAVPVIISRALELFIENLITETSQTTIAKNAKTLSTSHIKQTIESNKQFDFLRDLVSKIPDHQVEDNSADHVSDNGEAPVKKGRGRPRKIRDISTVPATKGETSKASDSSEEEEDEDDEETDTDEESNGNSAPSTSSAPVHSLSLPTTVERLSPSHIAGSANSSASNNLAHQIPKQNSAGQPSVTFPPPGLPPPPGSQYSHPSSHPMHSSHPTHYPHPSLSNNQSYPYQPPPAGSAMMLPSAMHPYPSSSGYMPYHPQQVSYQAMMSSQPPAQAHGSAFPSYTMASQQGPGHGIAEQQQQQQPMNLSSSSQSRRATNGGEDDDYDV